MNEFLALKLVVIDLYASLGISPSSSGAKKVFKAYRKGKLLCRMIYAVHFLFKIAPQGAIFVFKHVFCFIWGFIQHGL